MKTVEISISKGRNDHRFIINGETVYEGDAIANFVHKPFDVWKDVILDELYENCNDEFCVYLSSREAEYRYLEDKRKSFPKCVEIVWNGKKSSDHKPKAEEKVLASDDVWKDLNKLFERKGNRLKPTQKICMGLCVDSNAIDSYSDVLNSIIAVGFGSGSMSLKCPYYNFVIEEIEDYDIEDYDGTVFFVGEYDNDQHNVVAINQPEETGGRIKDYIAEKYIVPFLDDNMESTDDVPQMVESKSNSQVKLSVEIPESIDVGKSQLINIVGMPKMKALEILSFEMSESGILKYDRGRLHAIAPGSVEVRVKVKGKIEPVKRCVVEAIERFYVQKIELPQSEFLGTVGDKYQIKPVFSPSNAENKNEVKYESMNPRIAIVSDDGMVELCSTGRTKIRVSIGEVEAYLTVGSELKITGIEVSNESLKMSSGEAQALYVYVEPACYTVDSLEVSIDNKDVISFEKGIVKANAVGSANITFKSPNSNCTAKVQITVISSNYILARRAIQSKNYADASRYYEQIKMENPNDWESHFFSVYAKAYKAEVADISRSMELLMNSLEQTFMLILQLPSDEDRVDAIITVMRSCAQITQEVAQNATYEVARARVGSDHLESRGRCVQARCSCVAVDYYAANTVDMSFMSVYPQLKDHVLGVWKTGIAIEAQTIQYSSGQDKNILQRDITEITKSIRKYEPSYNAPRPSGGDSTFFDYLSFFI